MIGVFRLDGSGVIDAEEYLAAGQLCPLLDQGLDQGLRLGAGLAPDNTVSGANDARQVDHRTMLTAGRLGRRKGRILACMNFSISEEQQEIERAVESICRRFGDEYWRKKDAEGGFPHDFHKALAEAGWLGVAMPTEFGGAGLGISEAAIVMRS